MQYKVRHWLAQGWRDFRRTRRISMTFSSIFVVIGALAYWLLIDRGLGLIVYPLLSGFLVVAPLLVTGFQRVARMLHSGETPRFIDLFKGIAEATPGIWFLTFILCLCYLIWITDAIVLYGMFFGIEAVAINAELLTDAGLRQALVSYLAVSGSMGLLIAIMGFAVGAFSIPLILHQHKSFVSAVHSSVSTVWHNKILMLRWAFTLAALVLVTLVAALPLLVMVLPVTAYASYAAYSALLERQDIE